jgi:transposase
VRLDRHGGRACQQLLHTPHRPQKAQVSQALGGGGGSESRLSRHDSRHGTDAGRSAVPPRRGTSARAREPFQALAADCGFDGEEHHEFLHGKLGVLGIIPPERGRPRTKSDTSRRGGFFRNFIHQHWPKQLYGQRWQVETFFSMLKRLLDSFLRATNWRSQHREMCLKCLTLNFMLIAGAG